MAKIPTFAPLYERDCPYFARYYRWAGHDPAATCAFGCVDEPHCVTGSWMHDDEIAALKREFERDNGHAIAPEDPRDNGSTSEADR